MKAGIDAGVAFWKTWKKLQNMLCFFFVCYFFLWGEGVGCSYKKKIIWRSEKNLGFIVVNRIFEMTSNDSFFILIFDKQKKTISLKLIKKNRAGMFQYSD